jgi:hypothetical protein
VAPCLLFFAYQIYLVRYVYAYACFRQGKVDEIFWTVAVSLLLILKTVRLVRKICIYFQGQLRFTILIVKSKRRWRRSRLPASHRCHVVLTEFRKLWNMILTYPPMEHIVCEVPWKSVNFSKVIMFVYRRTKNMLICDYTFPYLKKSTPTSCMFSALRLCFTPF